MSLIRKFAELGIRYREAYLSQFDPTRIRQDRQYGLCVFLFSWAFERAGAPRGYRIAAVKAANLMRQLNRPSGDLPSIFSELYTGKPNIHMNPVFDRALPALDVPAIIMALESGEIKLAFSQLMIRGLGHKLRAFFLRDLASILACEEQACPSLQDYMWCQPVDVWARITAENLPDDNPNTPGLPSCDYGLARRDVEAAWKLVRMAHNASVSPLTVNQGIWYFCSNAVADAGRLRTILSSGDPGSVDAELQLLEGFLPVRPSW